MPIAERAERSSSRLLSMVSRRVPADLSKRVEKMIKKLIVKLSEDAVTEAEHKGWSDIELATNEHTRDIKTEDVKQLMAEVENSTLLKLRFSPYGGEGGNLPLQRTGAMPSS